MWNVYCCLWNLSILSFSFSFSLLSEYPCVLLSVGCSYILISNINSQLSATVDTLGLTTLSSQAKGQVYTCAEVINITTLPNIDFSNNTDDFISNIDNMSLLLQ